jgi:hypothetical protein
MEESKIMSRETAREMKLRTHLQEMSPWLREAEAADHVVD